MSVSFRPEYFVETPISRSRSNSNTVNSSRTHTLKKQRSMNALSSKLSRNLDNNQNTNEKVRWMLGAPVTSPQSVNPPPPTMTNTTLNNGTENQNCEKSIEEDSESSMDSANATEAKRLQSIKYSKNKIH